MKIVKSFESFMAIFLIGAFLFLFASCGPLPPKKEYYVLAYVTDQNKINVRYAEVASLNNWMDTKFPATVIPGKGVGLAIDQAGLSEVVLTDTPGSIKLTWGILANSWDNSSSTIPTVQTGSSPVAADLGNNKWLIAFNRSDAALYMGIYDNISHQFTSDISPQLGEYNTLVYGRPGITSYKNTLIITWQSNLRLIVAKGVITQGTITFGKPQVIPTPIDNTKDLAACPYSDPVIAHAGDKFFLMVVRKHLAKPEPALTGYTTQLFSSVDGLTWISEGTNDLLKVNANTFLGLAGTSEGTLLASAIGLMNERSVAKYSNGQWKAMPDLVNKMFNTTTANKPFVLITNSITK